MSGEAKRYLELVNRGISAAAQDSLADEGPKNETLAEHRKHCKAEKDECPFEKRMDDADAKVAEVGKKGGSAITPEEDAAYADAVKRGDKETALRMIREAAAKAGYDKEVWHYGSYSIPDTPNFGMHFGTFEAANDRSRDVDIEDGWFTHGFFNANKALRLADHGEWDSNTILGQLHSIYWQDADTRNKINSIRNKKNGQQKDNSTMSLLNALGYSGIIYQNKYEDYGQDSFIVTNPENIKSADITYDDAGNLIPLSKRFNMESADIRDEAKGFVRKYLEEVGG